MAAVLAEGALVVLRPGSGLHPGYLSLWNLAVRASV
jgi:hypothetical protein